MIREIFHFSKGAFFALVLELIFVVLPVFLLRHGGYQTLLNFVLFYQLLYLYPLYSHFEYKEEDTAEGIYMITVLFSLISLCFILLHVASYVFKVLL